MGSMARPIKAGSSNLCLLFDRLYQYRHSVIDHLGETNDSARFSLLEDGENQVYKLWVSGFGKWKERREWDTVVTGHAMAFRSALLWKAHGARVTLSLLGYDPLNALVASYQQKSMDQAFGAEN